MSPRELLGAEWWDKVRQEAYKKANYYCQACGIHKSEAKYHQWLEAHETYTYDYAEGIATVNEIVALCHACHNYIHSGRLLALYEAKEITEAKYLDILKHGDTLLQAHKLTDPDSPSVVADWSKWKIVINGQQFPTKWKSYEHWLSHYSG